jgi:hypothetical protein
MSLGNLLYFPNLITDNTNVDPEYPALLTEFTNHFSNFFITEHSHLISTILEIVTSVYHC